MSCVDPTTRKPPPLRASRTSKKRALVLVGLHLAIALHVAHWQSTGETLSPLEPSEAMEFSKHSIINAGFVFFGLTILSTLVLGRWFCGWACHLVALQDWSLWILGKLGIKPRPFRSRLLAWVPLVAALYMFFWPLAFRIWSGSPVTDTTVALTKTEFWETFPPLSVALLTFLVCGGLIVYFLGAKGFCTYACPYGAIFGAVDRLAPGRIRVTDACEGCGHCTATCTSNVRVHEEVRDHGMVVDPGCMKCGDCVSVCPMNALYFGFGKPAAGLGGAARKKKNAYSWAEEGLLAVFFLVSLFVYRGLYGRVPFLLALGLAAILAYLSLLFAKLFVEPDLSLGKKVLKRGGRLTRAGALFAAAMVTTLLATGHSGLIQYHDARSARASEDTLSLQQRALLLREAARGEELARVEAGLGHAEFVQRFGWLDVPGIGLRTAWLGLAAGDDDGFENELEAALERYPENFGLQENLGQFYQARGRVEEAVGRFEAALSVHPSVPLYDRLAQLHLATRRPDRALEVYEEAIRKLPENADLRFNLGIAYELNGRTTDALSSFEEVLRIDPERVDAHENLGRGYLAGGRFDEAVPHLERALELAPRSLDNLELLVVAYLESGLREQASQAVGDALASGHLPPEMAARYQLLIEQHE